MVHTTFFRLRAEKRERILAAARREFSEHVYEKSSINRILDEAGVPKGSFYQYFDDKSDLFFLCIRSVYKKILDARSRNHEDLLGAGMLRMKELGYDRGYQLFSEDLHTFLEEMEFRLFDNLGCPIPEEELYKPQYRERCGKCSMRMACNGCSNCGKC